MIKKNNIFKVDTKIKLKSKSWSFDSSLAKEFDNHINKSVPLYKDLHWLCLQVSDYFVREDSTVYDLGCSTGKLLNRLSIRHHHKKKTKFIGLDIINKMIQHAKKNNKRKNINFLKRDLIKTKFKKNDFVISFFTIQFIEQKNRQKLINKIFKSLNWGGAFFFAEKIRSSGARNQEMTNEIYKNWKLDQGFSLSEVNFKTESLKGVLDPFTHSGNVAMLKRAGFDEINIISKYLNFEIFLAIK